MKCSPRGSPFLPAPSSRDPLNLFLNDKTCIFIARVMKFGVLIVYSAEESHTTVTHDLHNIAACSKKLLHKIRNLSSAAFMVSRDPPTSSNPSIYDVFFANLSLIVGICWFQLENFASEPNGSAANFQKIRFG